MNLTTSLKKFNKLIFEEILQNLSFDFNHDENGNIFCDFKINDLMVNAKKFNDKLSFILTDKNGKSSELTEKEFSVKYKNEYDNFIELLKKYEENDLESSNNDEVSPINQMNDVLEKEKNQDPKVKLEKDIEIEGTVFNFKVLEDIAVENYVQCIFQYYDNDKQEMYGFKSLLFIKPANSVVVKILQQNDKGENMLMFTESDFKTTFPDLSEKFFKAVVKFEEFYKK